MSLSKICFINLRIVLKTYALFFLLVVSPFTYAQTLKIGDPAPLIEPYEWIKGSPVTTFEAGTAYVVEMGATWCKPCAATIPELTKLAKRYRNHIKVIGLFVKEIDVYKPEYLDRVKRYVEKKGELMSYHVAADGPSKIIEKKWIQAMSLSRGVPQTFVIDKEGRVAGHFVGANTEAVEDLIITIVDGSYELEEQVDRQKKLNSTILAYDRDKPLFVNGNAGDGSDFIFRSILAKAKENVKGSPDLLLDSYVWLETDKWEKILGDNREYYQKLLSFQGRYQTVNTTIAQLYQVAYGDTLVYDYPMFRWFYTGDYPDTTIYPKFRSAYGEQWKEAIVEASDSSTFNISHKWNYALNVPANKATAGYMQKLMQVDLKRYFGYEASVEIRTMPCWFLKARSGAVEKLKTITPGAKFQSDRVDIGTQSFYVYSNGDIRDFIMQLYSSNPYDDFPIIDKTGIPGGKIDYMVPVELSDYHKNRDFEGYTKILEEELGLYLEKGKKQMKVVVIRDPRRELN